jgi:phytanoyl-CoA hydroxylase
LHQDNQYIRHFPIIAAWVALDDCDEANGQMTVIPGSHQKGLLPVEKADLSVSFTNGQSVIPEGMSQIGVEMKAGDVLFFGGFIIHGSYPNKTTDRFRRSFICHFEAVHTTKLPADPATMMAALV